MLLLTTLWARPEDIPCSPKNRVAFHAAVLLGAYGGWRPASLLQVKYRDVQIGWLREAENSTNYLAMATVEIFHVKLREKIRRDQKHRSARRALSLLH